MTRLKTLYYKLKRHYYQATCRNLRIGYGTVIIGMARFDGRGSIVIGNYCRLDSPKIWCDGELTIGDRCYLNHTKIVVKSLVNIGKYCILSDAYIVDTDFHNLLPTERHLPANAKSTRPIHIDENVWIGDRGAVLKGSRIGKNTVIGSMAVVRGHIPADVVALGNPAGIVKTFRDPKCTARNET